jgi:hypothetical protein
MADFYLEHSSIKEFACRRVPYHYDEAGMYKDLVTYLRSQRSRGVTQAERYAYLRVRIFTFFI